MSKEIPGLGERIKRFRNMRRMSIDKLAAATGVSRSHLWKIESRDVGVSVDVLKSISDELDVDLGYLVYGNVARESPSPFSSEKVFLYEYNKRRCDEKKRYCIRVNEDVGYQKVSGTDSSSEKDSWELAARIFYGQLMEIKKVTERI